MRIPDRSVIGVDRAPLVSSTWPLACLAVAAFSLMGPSGCKPRPTSKTKSSARVDGGAATLDARGSQVDSEVYLNQHVPSEGAGGNGGRIRITSSGGDVTVRGDSTLFDEAAEVAAVVGTMILAGAGGLTVASGQEVEISGGRAVTFLDVQAGGKLILRDNTVILVTGDGVTPGSGDAFIGGEIVSQGGSGTSRQDGKDFSLTVASDLVITGIINCSGANGATNDVGQTGGLDNEDDPDTVGGQGGVVYIITSGAVVVTGSIFSQGGNNDRQDPQRGSAGAGGQIFIGTTSTIPFRFSGQAGARAGNSYTNNFTTGPFGGDITLISMGDVLCEDVTIINASGGYNTGLTGGNGGSVIIEAPIGDTTVVGVDINASGGRLVHTPTGNGGDGGTISFSGQALLTNDMLFDVSGGDMVEVDGTGGPAGSVTLSGSILVNVSSSVFINAQGGDSQGTTIPGGDGGNLFVTASDLVTPLVVFDGSGTVRGGIDSNGLEGDEGSSCVSGILSSSSLANFAGINNFPVASCGSTAFESFDSIVHDLDCDDATTPPGTFTTTLPAVLGADFYRVFFPGGATGVTITTSGEAGRNLDLFVGSSAVLGSTNPADYPPAGSSTNPDSAETVTVAPSGAFLSVWVQEMSGIVEEYTITITCTP